jgi:hypothetical protein
MKKFLLMSLFCAFLLSSAVGCGDSKPSGSSVPPKPATGAGTPSTAK